MVFNIRLVGSAQQDGRLKIGDRVVSIDGIDLSNMTQLEGNFKR